MPDTATYHWPYPALGDGPVNGPGAFEDLAQAIEATVSGIDASLGPFGRAKIDYEASNDGLDTDSNVFVDAAPAGPSATVDVGDSGTVLLIASVQLTVTPDATNGFGVYVGVDISGANMLDPGFNVIISHQGQKAGAVVNPDVLETAGFRIVTGLNTGSTTFKLMYESSNGVTNSFFGAHLVAVALP